MGATGHLVSAFGPARGDKQSSVDWDSDQSGAPHKNIPKGMFLCGGRCRTRTYGLLGVNETL